MGVLPGETVCERTVKGHAPTSVGSSPSPELICPSRPSRCVGTRGAHLTCLLGPLISEFLSLDLQDMDGNSSSIVESLPGSMANAFKHGEENLVAMSHRLASTAFRRWLVSSGPPELVSEPRLLPGAPLPSTPSL